MGSKIFFCLKLKKIVKFRFFLTTGKLKFFKIKMLHYFVDLDELIHKMNTVLGFEKVFHKVIEENWKTICVELFVL